MKNACLLLAVAATLATACTTGSKSENNAAESNAPAALARPGLPAPDTTTAPLSPDGLPRRYMGRQIAHIVGYQSVAWLDRPERARQERPDLLLKELALKPTDVVADIGAGTGYLTFKMSPLVPKGQVLAVDIQSQLQTMLVRETMQRNLTNVKVIRGTNQNPNLPEAAVDVALLVDTYHEFAFPKEMMMAIRAALKPGGRVVLVEYRAEDIALTQIKPLHKMSADQIKHEMASVGLRFREEREGLPQQHMLVFVK
jgi:precorrin-6B methylase 2